jgi:hypothetical protein
MYCTFKRYFPADAGLQHNTLITFQETPDNEIPYKPGSKKPDKNKQMPQGYAVNSNRIILFAVIFPGMPSIRQTPRRRKQKPDITSGMSVLVNTCFLFRQTPEPNNGIGGVVPGFNAIQYHP